MRTIMLLTTLAFILVLAFLTVNVAAREGFDVLVGISLLVLAMFVFGIVGALREPPDES